MKYLLKIKLCFIVAFSLLYACKSNEKPEGKPQSVIEITSEIDKQLPDSIYLDEGAKIVANSFKTLSSNLMNKMKNEGITGAIEFCNLAAYPLTDSLSAHYDVKIKRTTLKTRNKDNAPTELEHLMLKKYQSAFDNEQEINVELIKEGDKVHYFSPIYVMDACTKCHGVIGESLSSSANAKIKEFYPQDKATGYSSGDLRGMWSLEFTR